MRFQKLLGVSEEGSADRPRLDDTCYAKTPIVKSKE
jgi:hypothetical protein